MGGRAVQSPMAPFDFDAIFGENYLHFYLPMLDEDRNRAEAEEIIETLGLRPGDRVLDAPCGHGRISNLLAARGVVVVGVDASGLFLEKARTGAANAGVTVDYRAGHLRELPLGPNEDCDAVLNWFTSFGYFDDDGNKQVLREFHRALRPGGRLLLETIHRDAFVRVFTPAPFAYMTTAGPDGGDLQADRSTFELETGVLQTERTVVRAWEGVPFVSQRSSPRAHRAPSVAARRWLWASELPVAPWPARQPGHPTARGLGRGLTTRRTPGLVPKGSGIVRGEHGDRCLSSPFACSRRREKEGTLRPRCRYGAATSLEAAELWVCRLGQVPHRCLSNPSTEHRPVRAEGLRLSRWRRWRPPA